MNRIILLFLLLMSFSCSKEKNTDEQFSSQQREACFSKAEFKALIDFAYEDDDFISLELLAQGIPSPTDENKNYRLNQAGLYWMLDRACCYGHKQLIQLLIRKGADVNGYDDYLFFCKTYGIEFNSPLMQLVHQRNLEMVEYLFRFGVKVDFAEGEGYTALATAVQNNDIEMVKFLLSKGADKNFKTPEGTIIEIAKNKSPEILKLLSE